MVMEELHADLRGLEESIEGRLRRAGVTLLRGEARFRSTRSVSVSGTEYRGRSFVIATGTSPAGYPGIGLDGNAFISHRDLFARSQLCSGDRSAGRASTGKPAGLHGTRFLDTADFDRLIILGGDIEGVEFAQAFAVLGVGVTIVEMESELLPGVDEDLKTPVLRRLAEERVRVVTGRRAVSGGYGRSYGQPKRGSSAYERNGEEGAGEGEARVELDDGSALWADAVLITGSRSLNFPPGLQATGVEYGDGGITVDASLHCSVPGFFAAGEITGRGGPAHVAAVQGISAAGEAAAYLYPEAGRDERASTKETGSGEKHSTGGIPGLGQAGQAAPPGAIFTIPEIAGVGANERELRLSGRPYRVRRMELGETWRGFANSVAEGFVKLLLGEEGEILGCWWSAEDAAEIASMHAISMGTARAPLLDIDALLKAPYIHPTLSEAYRDIFLDNSPR
jgi:dihydrolipoamide dehydrogenase